MKVLAVILSTLIVVLSSYPCCQDVDSCPISSSLHYCGENESHDDAPHKNESPCSPFYNCGRCSGFTISYEVIDFDAFEPDLEILPVPYMEPLAKEVYFHDLKPPRVI
ncbi:MAG: hypothetical protein CMH46_05920 [Muricauda sp.]|nr:MULTISPECIES: DUF6660 family protein [unclassified Allomuricauda]MAU15061.1 hypothetical protein [Allomuricauda sp.]|tara:strand:+ start:21815 stop:22138 length:324 start_codon:yes stop_codon:yes gene_type:complete